MGWIHTTVISIKQNGNRKAIHPLDVSVAGMILSRLLAALFAKKPTNTVDFPLVCCHLDQNKLMRTKQNGNSDNFFSVRAQKHVCSVVKTIVFISCQRIKTVAIKIKKASNFTLFKFAPIWNEKQNVNKQWNMTTFSIWVTSTNHANQNDCVSYVVRSCSVFRHCFRLNTNVNECFNVHIEYQMYQFI